MSPANGGGRSGGAARPSGAPRSAERSRARILEAAVAEFAEHGYDGTSVRAVARRAQVDPALVRHYFGGKADLFAAMNQLPVRPDQLIDQVLAGPHDGRGERLVRTFLTLWDTPAAQQRLRAIIASATSQAEAAVSLREFIATEIFGRLTAGAAAGAPLGPTGAGALVASQMLGLAMSRYVLRVEPLASADAEEVVRWIGPNVQRYLELGLG